MAYDLSSVEKRIEFGTYWENYLLSKLNDNNLNFKKAVNKYSFFDFVRKDTSVPVIIEMKSIINTTNEDIFLVSVSKIDSYRKLLIKQPKTRFIFVYNQVVSIDDFQMYYYEIDMKLIDDYEFYITTIQSNQSKYHEVPKRLFKPFKDDFSFLK
jgi:hypothetical protein